ncbi:MAG: adenine deaminase, partial [Firmicutes bacterium]|nr:adenine deaminase [Bacillota bacterium]
SYHGLVELDVMGKIISPGFIDSHIHLESSLVLPYQFAQAVIPHGTTSLITDPHEIANVMGTDGIDYMLQATEGLPLDIYFVIPSCVPATPFDENFETLDAKTIDRFYENPRVVGLAEMMDFVGTLAGSEPILKKIIGAESHHKLIDGHAPGLSGKGLNAYVAAGISSDHECDTYENALDKLSLGQFIMIREGTAAKNLEALHPLLGDQYSSRCLFATDDKHPSDLLELGHIDYIIRKAIGLGADPVLALKVATFNAAQYFHLEKVGAIAPGYTADLVILDALRTVNVETVIKNGHLIYDHGKLQPFKAPTVDKKLREKALNSININKVNKEAFATSRELGVIGMMKDQIVTRNLGKASHIDVSKDILKIAVLERHHATGHIGLGYIKGYGLKKGAVATSIAHDAHNLIVVGTNEADMAFAVNALKTLKGGMVVVNDGQILASLSLPIAGLLSDLPLREVNAQLEAAKTAAFSLGVSHDIDPFMTLSFMSLSVIPELRIMTKGIFDVLEQKYL